MSVVLALALQSAAAAATGSAQAQPPPAAVQQMFDCRREQNAELRLACFDRAVAVLEQAQRSGEVVTVNRQAIRETRRSLFGLTLPKLPFLGGDDDDERAAELTTTIRSAREAPSGKWIFELAEGGRWEQTDSREFVVDPAPGQPIRIRRAAMGSYLANVNKQIAVRVRRIN